MTLLEIRTKFAGVSGRYDLVTALFADDGADYYLKAGIKLLDRLVDFEKDTVKLRTAVTVDDSLVAVPNQRVIQRVWFEDSTGSKTELDYRTPGDMDTEYPDGTATTSGTSTLFTMSIDTDQLTQAGILIMPPTNSAGTVEIWAKRGTPFPASEGATNFWFDSFEHLAIRAAQWQLESDYRNTQGQKDIMSSLLLELRGIEKDNIEDDAGRAEEMGQ